jgi:hypothetical protein
LELHHRIGNAKAVARIYRGGLQGHRDKDRLITAIRLLREAIFDEEPNLTSQHVGIGLTGSY